MPFRLPPVHLSHSHCFFYLTTKNPEPFSIGRKPVVWAGDLDAFDNPGPRGPGTEGGLTLEVATATLVIGRVVGVRGQTLFVKVAWRFVGSGIVQHKLGRNGRRFGVFFFLLFVVFVVRPRGVGGIGDAPGHLVQPCPNALEENLARPVPGSAGIFVALRFEGSLQIQDRVPDGAGTFPALVRNVFEDGLTGGGLGQTPDRVGEEPSKTGLTSAMAAAQSQIPLRAIPVAADAVHHGQSTGFHLGHGQEEGVRDQVPVLEINQAGVPQQRCPERALLGERCLGEVRGRGLGAVGVSMARIHALVRDASGKRGRGRWAGRRVDRPLRTVRDFSRQPSVMRSERHRRGGGGRRARMREYQGTSAGVRTTAAAPAAHGDGGGRRTAVLQLE